MLVRSPNAVRFGNAYLANVETIVVERSAHKTIEEWTDTGPHAVLVDVPEQRVSVKLVRRLDTGERPDRAEFVPGVAGLLGFFLAGHGSDASPVEVNINCVLTGMRYDAWDEPTRQVLTFIAYSEAAAQDPVIVLTGTRVASA